MFVKTVLGATLLALGMAAVAGQGSDIVSTIVLQDGSSVHVFSDGKMAMEDRFGRPASMKNGDTMQTRDGRSIKMVGNETARLDAIFKTQLGGGR